MNANPLAAVFPPIIASERLEALSALLSSIPVSAEMWSEALSVVRARRAFAFVGTSDLDLKLATVRTLWAMLEPALHTRMRVFAALIGGGVPSSLLEKGQVAA